ncbi:unnamed protein product [Clonostachys rhizophaga]|uniref:Uncharacterized protein n=1 Tax=Clonostachys rhizophaga TaxID=160324 RepID=A0A9N9VFZ8_9HYPO|nr:unnamed protein product [Clonostachys rhizophaga]
MSILHLVPVVTTTTTSVLANDQRLFLRIFLQKEVETNAKHVLTPYWKIMIDTVVPFVVAPLLGTIGSIGAILYTTPEEVLRTSGAYSWYVASMAFAAGHFLFVPSILPKIRGLQNGEPTPTLRQWLHIHMIRSLTVDLFALVAFSLEKSNLRLQQNLIKPNALLRKRILHI